MELNADFTALQQQIIKEHQEAMRIIDTTQSLTLSLGFLAEDIYLKNPDQQKRKQIISLLSRFNKSLLTAIHEAENGQQPNTDYITAAAEFLKELSPDLIVKTSSDGEEPRSDKITTRFDYYAITPENGTIPVTIPIDLTALSKALIDINLDGTITKSVPSNNFKYEFEVETLPDKSITTTVKVDFDTTDKITIARALSAKDEEVLTAMTALYDTNKPAEEQPELSITQIYHTMQGATATLPAQSDIEKIVNSLNILSKTIITIDNTREAANSRYKRQTITKSRLIDISITADIINNNLRTITIKQLRKPTLLQYAEDHNKQIGRIKTAALKSRNYHTDRQIIIKRDLIRRVKLHKTAELKLTFDYFYKLAGITITEANKSRDKATIKKLVLSSLDELQAASEIVSYTADKKEIQITIKQRKKQKKNT